MITQREALDRAERKLAMFGEEGEAEFVILTEATDERSWGWIFHYQSRRFLETGAIEDMLAGNAPLLVDRNTGLLWVTGTARSIEFYVRNYEATGDPHSRLGARVRITAVPEGVDVTTAVALVRAVADLGVKAIADGFKSARAGEAFIVSTPSPQDARRLCDDLRELQIAGAQEPERAT